MDFVRGAGCGGPEWAGASGTREGTLGDPARGRQSTLRPAEGVEYYRLLSMKAVSCDLESAPTLGGLDVAVLEEHQGRNATMPNF